MTQICASIPAPQTPQFGTGAPVILLHGSAGHRAQWRSMIGCMEGRFRLITPDLPGYGAAQHTGAGEMTLGDIARSLLPLTMRETQPVHLVGHSFGGAVALKFASLFPGRVASLTLIEPAAFNVVPEAAQGSDFIRAVTASRSAMMQGDADAAMSHFVDFWNHRGAWARTSATLRARLTDQIALVHRDFAALISDRFTEMDAANVVCPALVITGDQSPAEMAQIRTALVEKLPFARSEIITGAGHLLPMTDPHIVDPMVGEFIARIEIQWQDHAKAA